MPHMNTLAIAIATGVAFVTSAEPVLCPAAETVMRQQADETAIKLEVRQLVLPEESLAWFKSNRKSTLPALTQSQVIGDGDFRLLMDLASSSRIGNQVLQSTIRVPDGQQMTAAFLQPEFSETIQATASEDQQGVQLHLTFARNVDGSARLPDANVAVPAGSHLLIHYCRLSGRQPSMSSLGRAAEWLKLKSVKLAYSDGFILLTPRIVPGEQGHAEWDRSVQ